MPQHPRTDLNKKSLPKTKELCAMGLKSARIKSSHYRKVEGNSNFKKDKKWKKIEILKKKSRRK
jgi:hypothetical protein